MAERRKTIWIPTSALSRRQLLVGGTAAALALAACGGDDDDAATSDGTSPPADGAPPAPPPAPPPARPPAPTPRRHPPGRPRRAASCASAHSAAPTTSSTVSTSSARPTSPASSTGWEPLLNFDPDYNIVNTDSLAEEVETKAADLLRRRASKKACMFRDGKPVTADDVIYSFNRMIDPDLAVFGGSALRPILDSSGLTKIDERTVRDPAQAARGQLQRGAVRLHHAASCPTGTSASPAIPPTRSAPGRTSSRSSRSACSRSTCATRTTGTPASRTSTRCTSSTSPMATR